MLDDKEYERLWNILEYNVSTRTSLLTFSFTTVLAVIGVAIGTESKDFSVYIYLMPYCLIIPFTARIVYYRITHAHISAFLIEYAPEKMKFHQKTKFVAEKQNKLFSIIAILVNYEMFVLAITCAIIFEQKYFNTVNSFGKKEIFIIIVPILLSLVVFFIISYGYNYSKIKNNYLSKWNELHIVENS